MCMNQPQGANHKAQPPVHFSAPFMDFYINHMAAVLGRLQSLGHIDNLLPISSVKYQKQNLSQQLQVLLTKCFLCELLTQAICCGNCSNTLFSFHGLEKA